MNLKLINATERKTSQMDFGYSDRLGREIGMSATVWELDVVEAENGRLCRPEFFGGFGHKFVALTQATRNGKDYGASQSEVYFSERSERDTYLAKRWDASLKAAAKKSGK